MKQLIGINWIISLMLLFSINTENIFIAMVLVGYFILSSIPFIESDYKKKK